MAVQSAARERAATAPQGGLWGLRERLPYVLLALSVSMLATVAFTAGDIFEAETALAPARAPVISSPVTPTADAPGASPSTLSVGATRGSTPAATSADIPTTSGRAFPADGSPPTPSLAPPLPPAPAPAAPPAARPRVVLDPGHGGADPGAVSPGGLAEKTVTLAVARLVKREIERTQRLEVALTRETDEFVSLDRRVMTSSGFGADLFVSIHADSMAPGVGANIRGASVYVLSDSASDEEALRLAERENAADQRDPKAAAEPASGDVRGILADLTVRETREFSTEARSLIALYLKQSVRLAHAPERQAAFKVLRQPEAPAVLVELGYLSNPQDEIALKDPAWQAKAARDIAAALIAYFERRGALAADTGRR